MKRIILLIIFFLGVNLISGQSRFESEEDVFYYLNLKSIFKNKDSGIALTFSELGYQLSTGSSKYYQPEAVIVSETRAVVVFESIARPGATVKFIVDTEKNIIVDRSDGSVFYAIGSPELQVSNTSRSINRNPESKDRANVFYKTEYTLFDLLTDEPIYPNTDGNYAIYYATNENKTCKKLIVSPNDLTQYLVYKFKNLDNCIKWSKK